MPIIRICERLYRHKHALRTNQPQRYNVFYYTIIVSHGHISRYIYSKLQRSQNVNVYVRIHVYVYVWRSLARGKVNDIAWPFARSGLADLDFYSLPRTHSDMHACREYHNVVRLVRKAQHSLLLCGCNLWILKSYQRILHSVAIIYSHL